MLKKNPGKENTESSEKADSFFLNATHSSEVD